MINYYIYKTHTHNERWIVIIIGYYWRESNINNLQHQPWADWDLYVSRANLCSISRICNEYTSFGGSIASKYRIGRNNILWKYSDGTPNNVRSNVRLLFIRFYLRLRIPTTTFSQIFFFFFENCILIIRKDDEFFD